MTSDRGQAVRRRIRRLLGRRVSIEAMIELALWLTIPHIVIGLAYALLHYETVEAMTDRLQTVLPAGGDLITIVAMTLLWPLFAIVPGSC